MGTSDSEEISTNVASAGSSIIDGIYIGEKLYTGNGQVLYIMDYDSFAFGVGSEGNIGSDSFPIVGDITSRIGYVFQAQYTIIDGPPVGYENGEIKLEGDSLVWSFDMYEGDYRETYTFQLPQY